VDVTQALFSFAVVAGLLTLVPGVDTALVLRSALIVGAGFASRWLKGRRSVRIIDRITGTVLVGFGLKLALEPRP
jgi:threonine/homoserine/homoserine lactone efflux protein